MRRPGATRGRYRVANSEVIGTSAGPTATASPVRTAEYPQCSCNHRMRDNRPTPKAALNSSWAMFAHAKEGIRSSAGSITGASWCVISQTNAATPTTATAHAASTGPESQPQSLPWTRPRTSAPMATAMTAPPSRSGRGASALWRTSGTTLTAANVSARPIGTLIQNAVCQEICTSPPPTAGPKAAATAPVIAHSRAPAARRSAGSVASSSPSEAGVISDAPAACTMRKPTSHHSPGASPQARLASVKTSMPATNPLLRP